MAKVAIDIRLLGSNRTGDETVFFELTKELLASHPEHDYVLLTNKDNDSLEKVKQSLEISKSEARVEVVSFGKTNKFWWNAITMPLFLKNRSDIGIFHTQYILPFWLPRRLKVFAHIHDVSFARFPQHIAPTDLFFLRLFIPRTMRRANIVVPSKFTESEIQDLYNVNPERIFLVPNAIGSHFDLSRCVSEKSDVRARYQLPKEYILYVGTLQPRKNIPYLIQIFAETKKNYEPFKDMKLVLVGNRKAHHFDFRIDDEIKKSGLENEVCFPGFIDIEDLAQLYCGAKVFVFPSLYEGFGIPVLEAQSLGVPVAVSDIPVHHEVAGNEAAYFPLTNVAKAAEILYTISVKGPQNTFGETDQTKFLTRFSWSKSATLLARYYEKVVQ